MRSSHRALRRVFAIYKFTFIHFKNTYYVSKIKYSFGNATSLCQIISLFVIDMSGIWKLESICRGPKIKILETNPKREQ